MTFEWKKCNYTYLLQSGSTVWYCVTHLTDANSTLTCVSLFKWHTQCTPLLKVNRMLVQTAG